MSSGRQDRSSWPVRKYRLGEEPREDLSRETSPEQRLAMMWPLALEAWRLAGLRIPDYSIAEAPVRKVSVLDLDVR